MDFGDMLRDRLMSHASAGALLQPMPENVGIVVDGRGYMPPRQRRVGQDENRETDAFDELRAQARSNMIALRTAYRTFGWALE